MQPCPLLGVQWVSLGRHVAAHGGVTTHERTKRSRFSHLGFLGLNFMNLLKRTWETGAIPLFENRQHFASYRCSFWASSATGRTHMGAPGCPELLLKVASACSARVHQHSLIFRLLILLVPRTKTAATRSPGGIYRSARPRCVLPHSSHSSLTKKPPLQATLSR